VNGRARRNRARCTTRTGFAGPIYDNVASRLNPIAPNWLYGKRAIVKPGGMLSVEEVIDRVPFDYGCEPLYNPSSHLPIETALSNLNDCCLTYQAFP